MITRSFSNSFEVSDWTEELLIVPNQWGTINQMGLFAEEGTDTYSVTFEEITKDGALIVDKVRGERATVGKDATRKLRTWAVPHFPYDDYISPSDIKGKRAYGSPDQQESLAAVRMRKIERMAQNHAWTLEYARSKIITTGDVYAPNGTITALNFYTEFGITRKEIDFVFGTGTTDVLGKIEEAIAHIQDNAFGSPIGEIVALCSPVWFNKLIKHATVTAAYQYYTSTEEPLRRRLGGNTTLRREFNHAGVRFIEIRDSYNGTALIPSGDAYFIPLGSDIFETYFSPVNKFEFLGTLGERGYMFEYQSEKGDKIELESESNFLNACRKPAMVVRGHSSN